MKPHNLAQTYSAQGAASWVALLSELDELDPQWQAVGGNREVEDVLAYVRALRERREPPSDPQGDDLFPPMPDGPAPSAPRAAGELPPAPPPMSLASAPRVPAFGEWVPNGPRDGKPEGDLIFEPADSFGASEVNQ
jgi:hypothetical protein